MLADPFLSNTAAAWLQEASSDKIVPAENRTEGRTASRPIGSSSIRPPDDPKARSELADVLAKIGGNLGVSSEFHSIRHGEYVQEPSARVPDTADLC